MDEAMLASYRRQIIRRCLPQRHRQRTILEQFVLTVAPAMVWAFVFCGALFGILVISASFKKAYAHEAWISKGQFKNAVGELCCGEGDCFVLTRVRYSSAQKAFLILDRDEWSDGIAPLVVEIVPESEAQPSPDGAFWRCKRPDGSRRCFFAPRPGS